MSELISNLNTIESCKLDIKSAIEAKGVSMSGVSFPDYATAIGNIPSGGTFVTTTLSVSQNGTYYPGQGVDGFSEVSVNVPQSVTGYTINDVATGNYNLTTLNCSVSWVRAYAFYRMSTLTSIDLPNCEQLGGVYPGLPVGAYFIGGCFARCSNLISVSLPACFIIGGNVFENCSALQSINLPLCKRLEASAFHYCTSLTTISLPACENIDTNVFYNCTSLTTISLPACKIISASAFISCINLTSVDFSVCRFIGNYAFSGCYNLTTVILRTSTVCSLGTRVFSGATALTSIYVPSSLVSDYQVASYWSSLANKIVSIPE